MKGNCQLLSAAAAAVRGALHEIAVRERETCFIFASVVVAIIEEEEGEGEGGRRDLERGRGM